MAGAMNSPRSGLRTLAALGCVVVTVITWIASAQILQRLQRGQGLPSGAFPAFNTWLVHSAFALFAVPLLGSWGYQRCRRNRNRSSKDDESKGEKTTLLLTAPDVLRPFSAWRWIVVGTLLGLLNFCFEYCWYVSLPRTSVSANTAVYNSAPAWVFVLSALLLGERVTICKIVALLCCVSGVAVVGIWGSSPSEKASSSSSSTATAAAAAGEEDGVNVYGYAMLVLSTLLYSLYQVLFGRFAVDPATPKPTFRSTFMFTTAMGVSNILLLWPPFVALNAAGVEPLDSLTPTVVGILVGLGFLSAILNVFAQMAIMLAGPLFVSVCQLLTIPSGVAVDALFNGFVMPAIGFAGVALIVTGFLLINAGEFWNARFQASSKGKKRAPSSLERWLFVGTPLCTVQRWCCCRISSGNEDDDEDEVDGTPHIA